MEGMWHMALSQLCVPIRLLASLFQSNSTLDIYIPVLHRRDNLRAKVELEGSLCQCPMLGLVHRRDLGNIG